MKGKGQDWVQATGGWRLRLPCGESVSQECAEELGLGSPPDSAYVRVVEENRELFKEIRRLKKTIKEAKRLLEKE